MKRRISVIALALATFTASPNARSDQESHELPTVQVISSTLDTGCTFTSRASRFTRKLTGLLVKEVRPDSVAAIAGLKARDRVVVWNGIDLRGKDPEFIYTIRIEAKDRMITLPLVVLRRGQRHPETITLKYKDVSGSLEFVRQKRPNQPLEPTTLPGTSAAEQPLVPSRVVAHL